MGKKREEVLCEDDDRQTRREGSFTKYFASGLRVPMKLMIWRLIFLGWIVSACALIHLGAER